MTKKFDKILYGCYTRMLRMALNVNQYRDRMHNYELYGNLPLVSFKIRQRRLRLADHAAQHPELSLHKVLLWEPNHGRRSRGRPKITFVKNLLSDRGVMTTREIQNLMLDREGWQNYIQDPRAQVKS